MGSSTNTERDQQIAAKARHGQTHENIAREHGLTRARVSQIVAAANPQSPDEAQRQLIAARLRSRWDVLEELVRHPPEQHSAIGRPVIGSDGKPIINASAIIAAVREQLKIEQQYRQMFGVDLGTRPGPLLDEAHIIMRAEITVAQQYLGRQAPLPPLQPLPDGYYSQTPEQQARTQVERTRAQLAALPATARVIQGQAITEPDTSMDVRAS